MTNDVRKIENDIVKYYELSISSVDKITHKTYKINDKNGNSFFIKKTIPNALEKYHFLYNQSCNNILFPILNNDQKYVTKINKDSFYLNDFYKTFTIKKEVNANNMFRELNTLHYNTSFKRQLNPFSTRPKFDEMSNRLDYQFRILEEYVRNIESRPLEPFSMQILGNYHIILNAKNEMIKLQKRIISTVKQKEGINYSFIHNNPKLEHLLNIKGVYYLTSIENGKIGINSLDIAKFYLENEHLNIDFKSILNEHFKNENNQFYYDYFRYLVLLIIIRRINITDVDHINSVLFMDATSSIKRYFENFSDYQEEVS